MQKAAGRSRQADLLTAELETSPGSGVFEVDERLRVERVSLGSDDAISTARFAVRIDSAFDAAAAKARYLPDLRVVVRAGAFDGGGERVLFEGHPPLSEARWRGGPGGGEESFGFTASHVYERLSRDRRAWIYGRRMRSGEIEQGLIDSPALWQDKSILVEALPCVFNLDGRPNRAAVPLTVHDSSGWPRSIHVFADDDAPAAEAWTYLAALHYLVWFHAPREGPVFEGNVFTLAESGDSGSSRAWHRLLRQPESLNCEATNLVEALALLSDAAGVHATVDTDSIDGIVRSQLRVWATGDGVRRDLRLAPGGAYADGTKRFDASALSATDVFRANELRAADVRWDDRLVVNAPIVIGGVKGYEMTFPLAPGWLPTENLDTVAPVDRAAAKELALTPEQVIALGELAEASEWFRRYHREGSEHAEHRYVGRRWALNEDGRFDGATFNRNAPFDDYRPFDFSTVTGHGITRPGAWSRRSREFLTTVTRSALGAGFGVYVEVSFDSGANWFVPAGPVAVTRRPSAIVFEVSNPTQITPPGVDPLEQNMWYAIIDQTFRVRVTAVIEGDDRLIARPAPLDGGAPTLLTSTRVERAPSEFGFHTRQGTTNVLATVNPDATDIERDDGAAILDRALDMARRDGDRRVTSSPVVPWLDTRFEIGDEVVGMRGRGLSFSTGDDCAAVTGKEYRLDGGRWETGLVVE